MSDSPFLMTALAAADAAALVTMSHYRRDVQVGRKPDGSAVTMVDMATEKAVIKFISSRHPEHGFLTEEGGERNADAEYVWIIDPIDGTMNYIRGLPLFSTLIALMKNGEPILGLSCAPALGEMMYAEKNGRAYLNHKPVRVSSTNDITQSYLSFGDLALFERRGLMQQLATLSKWVGAHRGIGDFWSYHLLAQGRIDVMTEAQVRIWDVAPFKVIVEAAGGQMTDMQGNTIDRDTSTVVATNGKLHQQALAYFKPSSAC